MRNINIAQHLHIFQNVLNIDFVLKLISRNTWQCLVGIELISSNFSHSKTTEPYKNLKIKICTFWRRVADRFAILNIPMCESRIGVSYLPAVLKMCESKVLKVPRNSNVWKPVSQAAALQFLKILMCESCCRKKPHFNFLSFQSSTSLLEGFEIYAQKASRGSWGHLGGTFNDLPSWKTQV